MVSPLAEYAGDTAAPATQEEALAWIERELAAARTRWTLPDPVRAEDAHRALVAIADAWASGRPLYEAIADGDAIDHSDARYALAIAIGSGGRASVPGGAPTYSFAGDPLADIANHTEVLPESAVVDIWAWFGRAVGLTVSAWPYGHADFAPFGLLPPPHALPRQA